MNLLRNANKYPHRALAVIGLFSVFSVIPLSAYVVSLLIASEGTDTRAGAATIDISAQAIQKPHTAGVPHTDVSGNFKSAYGADSFLPIGIYNPTLCQVTKTLSWAPPAGYTGEYRVKVHYGTNRDIGSYLLTDINVGTGSSNKVVGNLPPSSALYYSVWQVGTTTVVAEGNFTSDACTNTAEDNNLSSIKNAGYNLAILEKNIYPDNKYLTKAQEAGVRLLLDLRDRPTNTFANLKDNANVFGFYVGDDDLARTKANNGDPQPVYDSINAFADSIDSQTSKVVLAAEPDILPTNSYWWPWYGQFDSIGNVSFHYNYPKSSSALFPWVTISDVADTVAHQVQVNGSSRPSWFIKQAINLKWKIPLEFPTAAENRAMAYTALIHGATGLFDFSYDGWFRRQPKGNVPAQDVGKIQEWDRHAGIKANTPTSYPGGDNGAYLESDPAIIDRGAYEASSGDISASQALWNGIDASQNGLNKQLNELKAVVLSPTLADDYKVFVDHIPAYDIPYTGIVSPTPIRTLLKQYGGDTYLFAVNIDNEPINVKLELTGKAFDSAEVLYEGRNAVLSGGNTIGETFSAFDVNVYKLKAQAVLPQNKFKAEYFNNVDFTDLVLIREEDVAKVAIKSPGTVPVPELISDGNFAVRWEGRFNLTAGKYRFNSQPGRYNSRVYVDDVLRGDLVGLQNVLVDISSGDHKIKFEFVVSNSTYNYSYLTNFFDRTTCYDLTADSLVNSQDLGVVAQHFLARGETGWDINGDDVVNAIDNSQIAQKFNVRCPFAAPTPPPAPVSCNISPSTVVRGSQLQVAVLNGPAGATLPVSVIGAFGTPVYDNLGVISGALGGSITIPAEAQLGLYRVRLDTGNSNFVYCTPDLSIN